jgi:hypothetical protein
MPKLIVSASLDVSDNQREHAKFIAGLEQAAAAFEAEIERVTGQTVKIDMSIRKVTGPRAPKTAGTPPGSVSGAGGESDPANGLVPAAEAPALVQADPEPVPVVPLGHHRHGTAAAE